MLTCNDKAAMTVTKCTSSFTSDGMNFDQTLTLIYHELDWKCAYAKHAS